MLAEEEAIAVAARVAQAEGWPWEEPITARLYAAGRAASGAVWHVMSNVSARGRNVNVHVDRQTGAVLMKAFAPR